MKTIQSIFIFFILIFFTACSNNINNLQQANKVYGFSFIKGTVLEKFGDKIIVEIENKDVVVGDSYEDRLTNKIITNSILITGMKTYIGNETAYIEDVRKNQITFQINNSTLKSDETVKIFIPKKTIAVMDFSLIGTNNTKINKFLMEDMTTKMVQSGQYIVVERTKLDTILKEHKLADSGLMDKQSAKKIGKLLSANLILTGSFAKQSNHWNVNLRLVDVSTGIIISAINDKIALDQFRLKQSHDRSNFNENFENKKLSQGWIQNIINKRGARSTAKIDTTTGAKNSTNSFKITYFLSKEPSATIFANKRVRDVSSFEGIKLYAKAQKFTTLHLSLDDKNYDNSFFNRWFSPINISNKWQEYKIPFNELLLARKYNRQNPGGDGKLDLDAVQNIALSLRGRSNLNKKHISIWIDEISFY